MIKVAVYDIEWCVEDEDVMDMVDDFNDLDAIEDAIEEVLGDLPTQTILDIREYDNVDFDNDEGMLEEAISETLSNIYGWLVDSYSYEVLPKSIVAKRLK